MRLPFECPAAMQLNKDIFETMYFASLEASCEIAEKEGAYSTYEGNTTHTYMYHDHHHNNLNHIIIIITIFIIIIIIMKAHRCLRV